MKTLPYDVTKVGRGQVQKAILEVLHNGPHRGIHLTDLSRYAQFRGVHFGRIMNSGEALQRRGLITITTPEPGRGDVYKLVPHVHPDGHRAQLTELRSMRTPHPQKD